MKRKLTGLLALALASGSIVGTIPAVAEENGTAFLAFSQEAAELPNVRIEETIQTEVEGAAITMRMTAMKGELGINDVNVYAAIEIPELGFAYEIALEDLVRVVPDACYLNTGEIFDTVSEVMGNGIAERFAKMFGLTEDWIKISPTDCDIDVELPMEAMEKLAAGYMTAVNASYAALPCEAVENGWTMSVNNETYLAVMSAMFAAVEENQAAWVDDCISILKEIDVAVLVDELADFVVDHEYVVAAEEGIQEIDPSFELDDYVDMFCDELELESVLQMAEYYQQDLETISSVLMELDFSAVTEEMRQELEATGMDINYDLTMTKDADGVYTVVVNEQMSAEGETVEVQCIGTITPVAVFDVEEPTEYVELTDLIRDVAATVYMCYYISEYDIMEGSVIGSDPYEFTVESEEYVQETLTVDGNRFLLEDWYGEDVMWITFDSETLIPDLENSIPQAAFLDFADEDAYAYVGVDYIDYYSFGEYYNADVEFYTEQYALTNISDLAVTQCGDNQVQYYTVEMRDSEEEDPYYMLVFGVDTGNGTCIEADYFTSTKMTMAEIHSLINRTFAGLESAAE